METSIYSLAKEDFNLTSHYDLKENKKAAWLGYIVSRFRQGNTAEEGLSIFFLVIFSTNCFLSRQNVFHAVNNAKHHCKFCTFVQLCLIPILETHICKRKFENQISSDLHLCNIARFKIVFEDENHCSNSRYIRYI